MEFGTTQCLAHLYIYIYLKDSMTAFYKFTWVLPCLSISIRDTQFVRKKKVFRSDRHIVLPVNLSLLCCISSLICARFVAFTLSLTAAPSAACVMS